MKNNNNGRKCTDGNRNNLIRIIAQGFYGNRTITEICPEEMDSFILGYLDSSLVRNEEVDRTIIRIQDSENLVLIYNKYQEERRRKRYTEYKEEEHTPKPLATIPEYGQEIFSRCIVCRMNAEGVFESLEKEDCPKFMKYLSK